MDLKKLKDALTLAGCEAKNLPTDANDGRSPFAAGIRSNLDHAAELTALHENWLKENPLPKPAVPASAPAAK